VLQLSDILEINQTVDLAGLTEPPKLSMIDIALKATVLTLSFYQLLIPLHAVDSFHVYQWDAMEDKLVPHGAGSKEPVLFLEEISVIKTPVSLTPWNNAPTMFNRPLNHAIKLLKMPHHVPKLAHLEIMLIITLINTKLLQAMDLAQLMISKKILWPMDQLLLLSLFMKILLLTNLEFTDTPPETPLEDTLLKLSDGEKTTGSLTIHGMTPGEKKDPSESPSEIVELIPNAMPEKFEILDKLRYIFKN